MNKEEIKSLISKYESRFTEKALKVHGNKYDYSKVKYIDAKTKVCITCLEHGDYWQSPNNHINGQGCPICGRHKKNKIFGVAIFDYNNIIKKNTIEYKSYTVWYSMIRRCYSYIYQKNKPTYEGCTVCDEWLYFSNFKKWFDENYIEGFQLDKDIIIRGNKVYSPQTCCFVPKEINIIFQNKSKRIYDLPIGVYKTRYNKYRASLHINGKTVIIGNFNSPKEAFEAYKKEKEKYIKELANKWKDKIDIKAYNSLINYVIEPEEVPMKPNQILLVSVYQVMALNEMCNCCVLDIEPSIKNKDKETKKLFYAAKKRVNWYQKEVNNLTISSGTVYVDFNDNLDVYIQPLLFKYRQALEDYLFTIKGVENPYFASLVEVARSMTKLSITEISNRIKECIKFAEDSIALRHYKQKELLDIINNLVKWVFRKAEDINYNDSPECVEAYKNLVDAYQNPNIIGECIIKAQHLNDKEDESKI